MTVCYSSPFEYYFRKCFHYWSYCRMYVQTKNRFPFCSNFFMTNLIFPMPCQQLNVTIKTQNKIQLKNFNYTGTVKKYWIFVLWLNPRSITEFQLFIPFVNENIEWFQVYHLNLLNIQVVFIQWNKTFAFIIVWNCTRQKIEWIIYKNKKIFIIEKIWVENI